MVAVGQNPSVSVSKAPVEPPPVPSYKDKWVKRVYRSVKTSTSSSTVSFSVSDFGLPTDTVVYVDKVQLWNLTANARGMNGTFHLNTTTDLGNDDVVASDFSSLGQCPGMTFKVPTGHAKGVSNSSVIADMENLFGGTSVFGTGVCHLHCWVAY